MIAFVLPVFWAGTALLGLAKLYNVSSKLTLGAMMFDRWQAKQCVKLGVNPGMFGLGLDDEEKKRRALAYASGDNLDETGNPVEARIMVIEVEPHQAEGLPDLVGTWAFVGREYDAFMDGIHHRENDPSYQFDFASLRKFSDERLKSLVFRKAAGLPIFG